MTKIRSSSSSRVRDRRGAGGGGRGGGGGGFGFPMGGGGGRGIPMGAGGGGIIGLLVLAAIVILPRLLGGGGSGGGTGDSAFSPAVNEAPSEADSSEVAPGETPCLTEIEQVVCGAVDDVSIYWEDQFPVSFQGAFPGTDTVFFSGGTSTGCGQASSQTGPFYCPADQLVYFDLDFLQQLQENFGATGDLAAQYIVAHEYGHHVQNVTGINDRVRTIQQQSPDVANEFSVALELQADCFAGAWASSVAERDMFDRPEEIDEALAAAEAVGDDRIMESAGQEVNPESFTHGSAEQRRTWFEKGFQTGDPEECRTFNDALAP